MDTQNTYNKHKTNTYMCTYTRAHTYMGCVLLQESYRIRMIENWKKKGKWENNSSRKISQIINLKSQKIFEKALNLHRN